MNLVSGVLAKPQCMPTMWQAAEWFSPLRGLLNWKPERLTIGKKCKEAICSSLGLCHPHQILNRVLDKISVKYMVVAFFVVPFLVWLARAYGL